MNKITNSVSHEINQGLNSSKPTDGVFSLRDIIDIFINIFSLFIAVMSLVIQYIYNLFQETLALFLLLDFLVFLLVINYLISLRERRKFDWYLSLRRYYIIKGNYFKEKFRYDIGSKERRTIPYFLGLLEGIKNLLNLLISYASLENNHGLIDVLKKELNWVQKELDFFEREWESKNPLKKIEGKLNN